MTARDGLEPGAAVRPPATDAPALWRAVFALYIMLLGALRHLRHIHQVGGQELRDQRVQRR
jgi:hypothetical protein